MHRGTMSGGAAGLTGDEFAGTNVLLLMTKRSEFD